MIRARLSCTCNFPRTNISKTFWQSFVIFFKHFYTENIIMKGKNILLCVFVISIHE